MTIDPETVEQVWFPCGTDDTMATRLTCSLHPEVPPFTAMHPCVECMKPPKRPADIEVPEWWVPHSLGMRCTEHNEIFGADDEACRRCLETLDEEDE